MSAPTIPVTTFELPSHCIVTVSTGTTYTPDLHRSEVHTRLAIRFEAAYPLSIKGIWAGEDLRGFDLTLTGTDELEQLILALETAASELRNQMEQRTPPPAPRTLEEEIAAGQAAQPDPRVDAAREVQRAETYVVELLATAGSTALTDGELVADYLLAQLREESLIAPGCAQLWQLAQQARATGELPTLAWLRERADLDAQQVLQQAAYEQELTQSISSGLREMLPPLNLRRSCDYAVAATQRAHVLNTRAEILARVQQLGEEFNLPLLERFQELTQQLVQLTERTRALTS